LLRVAWTALFPEVTPVARASSSECQSVHIASRSNESSVVEHVTIRHRTFVTSWKKGKPSAVALICANGVVFKSEVCRNKRVHSARDEDAPR
jgi:hypothetical protein